MEQLAADIVSQKLGEKVLGTDLQTNVNLVRQEIERLSNAILHLRRSNEELAAEDPNDPDFFEAIQENSGVIKKYTSKIAELMELLEALQGPAGTGCGSPDVSNVIEPAQQLPSSSPSALHNVPAATATDQQTTAEPQESGVFL